MTVLKLIFGESVINTGKSNDLRLDPCGTPELSINFAEVFPLNFTTKPNNLSICEDYPNFQEIHLYTSHCSDRVPELSTLIFRQ